MDAHARETIPRPALSSMINPSVWAAKVIQIVNQNNNAIPILDIALNV
jgi:hypothetical protein